jgi:pantetheine-phosphate adenylyltransferase
MTELNKRIAVCPGSYDPITRGHLDIIGRASCLFDEVVVAVVNHSVRKSKSLFSAEERISFIEEATSAWPNVRAEPFTTLVVDVAREVGASTIFGGSIDELVTERVARRLQEELAR